MLIWIGYTETTGLKINFVIQEPVGDLQKNFGRQLILYITYTRTWFYMLLCMQEKSQLKSENN